MSSMDHFSLALLARQVWYAVQVPVIPSSPLVSNLRCAHSWHTQWFYALGPLQIELGLISLTWEKFLALILTSFSTSCCRWKVSSCSLFSASSLLLLSSSSIWRRARHSRSWRTRLPLNIFFDLRAELKSHKLDSLSQRPQLSLTFIHLCTSFSCREPLATGRLLKQELWAICRSNMYDTKLRRGDRQRIPSQRNYIKCSYSI